ncbi:class I SAM-dependent methyltransferase [Scytonema sp. PRP1]|uniref:class I SAM-dependent methyltransferase n=1 Tax=Scytonema sp. PRP1 TaxID=3120513 RepID=UPI002FD0175B
MEESASGIAIASQNFPDCHFIQASIYDSPKAELLNAFDIVISVEVIKHLFYPRELVRLARKCLKPGGHLIMTTPYHGYLKNLILALSGKMDNHFSVLWDGGHIKFFSVKSLSELLETEGYTNIQFKFAGRLPYLWKSTLCCASIAEK